MHACTKAEGSRRETKTHGGSGKWKFEADPRRSVHPVAHTTKIQVRSTDSTQWLEEVTDNWFLSVTSGKKNEGKLRQQHPVQFHNTQTALSLETLSLWVEYEIGTKKQMNTKQVKARPQTSPTLQQRKYTTTSMLSTPFFCGEASCVQ